MEEGILGYQPAGEGPPGEELCCVLLVGLLARLDAPVLLSGVKFSSDKIKKKEKEQ